MRMGFNKISARWNGEMDAQRLRLFIILTSFKVNIVVRGKADYCETRIREGIAGPGARLFRLGEEAEIRLPAIQVTLFLGHLEREAAEKTIALDMLRSAASQVVRCSYLRTGIHRDVTVLWRCFCGTVALAVKLRAGKPNLRF